MSNPITLVLMTCGELTEERCLKAIEPFRHEVEFLEIRNVCPQIKALNQMIEGVQTEYFIPLDADMVLYDGSWDRIMNAWRKHWRDPTWHSVLFPLWDTLTDRKILALKMLRTSIMKENPFIDSPTPDVEHYQRLTNKGYTCVHDYLKQAPVGDHIVTGKHFCYFKYRDVYQTYRAHNFEWDSGAFMGGENLRERAKCHFDFFLYKWIMTRNEDYLHCIAGMLDGILSPLESRSKTLDSHEYRYGIHDGLEAFFEWYAIDDPLQFKEALLF